MNKRSQLTADTPICEHNLTPNELTLEQLTEWDLRFTREFSKEMYTRVRENSRSMYVLMREILPILDLLVGKNELPQEYTARIRERVIYFLRDVLSDAQSVLPRRYQQKNRRNEE